MKLSPAHYGLHSRTLLQQLGTQHIGIIKIIKSRIIRKDAIKIVEMAEKIRLVNPEVKVSLICTPNICSKSVALLEEKDISIQIEN